VKAQVTYQLTSKTPPHPLIYEHILQHKPVEPIQAQSPSSEDPNLIHIHSAAHETSTPSPRPSSKPTTQVLVSLTPQPTNHHTHPILPTNHTSRKPTQAVSQRFKCNHDVCTSFAVAGPDDVAPLYQPAHEAVRRVSIGKILDWGIEWVHKKDE